MENGPFIDGLPWFTELKNGDFPWQTVSHNQMVYIFESLYGNVARNPGNG